MTKYRKQPIEVEAIVYDGSRQAIADFMGDRAGGKGVLVGTYAGVAPQYPLRIWIEKSNAWGCIEVGDAVIRESDGIGVYPCAKAVFEATYEPVEGD